MQNHSSLIKIFSISFVVTALLGGAFYYQDAIVSYVMQTKAPESVIQFYDELEEGNTEAAFSNAYGVLYGNEINEPDRLELLREMAVVTAAIVAEDPTNTEIASRLYAELMNHASQEEFTSEFRAGAAIVIDKLFWETGFDVMLFDQAFGYAIDDEFYFAYSDAAPVERVYRLLFDINERAAVLSNDKYVIGFQAWVVAVSLLASPPEDDLLNEFAAYLKSQTEAFQSAEYLLNTPPEQIEWLEITLETTYRQLNELNPEVFSLAETLRTP